METAIAQNTLTKTGAAKKTTPSKKTNSEWDITPEEREKWIKELKASLEKSLETERLAKEKNELLWSIPKEKMTAKERRQGIAALKASVKRGIGRRSREALLRRLENDRDR